MAYFRPRNKNMIFFKFWPLRVNFWPQVVDFEPLAVNFITMNVSFMHLRVLFSPWKSTLILCELNLGIWESIFGSGSWFWACRGWVLCLKSGFTFTCQGIDFGLWGWSILSSYIGFKLRQVRVDFGPTEVVFWPLGVDFERRFGFTHWESPMDLWE